MFELTPAGVETVLYNFCFTPNCNDGVYPQAGLLADTKGNLYGTTLEGGTSRYGTVFEHSPPAITGGAWSITVLHAFTEKGSDGSYPLAGLIADMMGNLYGTTSQGGGTKHAGTVFELTPPIGFVPPVPFAAFSAQLLIQFGNAPNTDLFELSSNFTLGSASNGINPPAEPVTLQVGTFTTTIPSLSFTGAGSFSFQGVINGVDLTVGISPTGTKRYAFTAVATNASLTGTGNPVPVTLTIGADTGTVSVTAAIASGLAVAP